MRASSNHSQQNEGTSRRNSVSSQTNDDLYPPEGRNTHNSQTQSFQSEKHGSSVNEKRTYDPYIGRNSTSNEFQQRSSPSSNGKTPINWKSNSYIANEGRESTSKPSSRKSNGSSAGSIWLFDEENQQMVLWQRLDGEFETEEDEEPAGCEAELEIRGDVSQFQTYLKPKVGPIPKGMLDEILYGGGPKLPPGSTEYREPKTPLPSNQQTPRQSQAFETETRYSSGSRAASNAPSKGGSFAQSRGGSYAPSKGDSFAPSQGGSYAQSKSGSVTKSQGGSTTQSKGGSYAPSQGSSFAQSQGGSHAQSKGNSFAQSQGGSYAQSKGGSAAQSQGGSFAQSKDGSFAQNRGASFAPSRAASDLEASGTARSSYRRSPGSPSQSGPGSFAKSNGSSFAQNNGGSVGPMENDGTEYSPKSSIDSAAYRQRFDRGSRYRIDYGSLTTEDSNYSAQKLTREKRSQSEGRGSSLSRMNRNGNNG